MISPCWRADPSRSDGIGVVAAHDETGAFIGAASPVGFGEAFALLVAWRDGSPPANVVRDPQGELRELLQRIGLYPRRSLSPFHR